MLVFSPEIEPSLRLDSYCCILRYVCDERDAVALEAICCLMKHQNAWQIMIDFQNRLHDIYVFECVVDRLHKCLKGGVLLRGQGREDQSSGVASLQAACRMCCVVGETLQRAVSFELINFNQNGRPRKLSPGSCVFTSEPFFASPTDIAPVLDGEDSSHSHSRTHTPPLVVEDLLISPLLSPSTSSPIKEQQALIDLDKTGSRRSVLMHNIDAITTLCSLLWDDALLNNQNRSLFSWITILNLSLIFLYC